MEGSPCASPLSTSRKQAMDGVDSLVNPFIQKPKFKAAEAGLKYAESTLPQVNPGLVSTTGRLVGGALTTAGNILDLPGSSVRDVVDLKNPLDQWLDPVGYNADSNRVSGRQLARDYGMVGEEDNWGNFAGGMAAEIALDPLTYLTLGAGSLTKAGNVVKKTGQASKVKGVANQIVRDSAAKQGKRVSKQVSTWGAKSKVTPQMMADTLQGKAKQEFLDDWKRITGDDLAKSALKDQPLQSAAGLQMNFPFVRGALKKLNLLQDKPFWTDQVANVGTVKDPMGALERWAARHGEAFRDASPPKDPPAGGSGPSGPDSGPLAPRNPPGTPEPDAPQSPSGEPVSLSERMREFRGSVDSFDQAMAQANAELGDGQPFNGWRPRYQQVRSLGQFRDQAKLAFNLDDEQADAVTAVLEARAQTWAETTGRKQEEYFGSELGGVSLQDDPFTRDLLGATGDLQSNKGFASYTQEAGTVIGGFEAADFSTAVHELSHVFYKDLERLAKDSPEVMADLEVLAKNFGDEAGNFSQAGREKFARQFERYARDGKAPAKELESVFARVKKWMSDIYKKLKGTPIEQGIKPEVRGVFDRMLSGEASVLSKGTGELKLASEWRDLASADMKAFQKLSKDASEDQVMSALQNAADTDFADEYGNAAEQAQFAQSARITLEMLLDEADEVSPPLPAVREAPVPPAPAARIADLDDESLRKLNKDAFVEVDGETITDPGGEALDEIYRRMDEASPPPPAVRDTPEPEYVDVDDDPVAPASAPQPRKEGVSGTSEPDWLDDYRISDGFAEEIRSKAEKVGVRAKSLMDKKEVFGVKDGNYGLSYYVPKVYERLKQGPITDSELIRMQDPDRIGFERALQNLYVQNPIQPVDYDGTQYSLKQLSDAGAPGSSPARMRYQDVKVGQLKTWEELSEAREAIENHPDNVVGGLEAWDSGASVDLKPAAKRKMAQLQSRMDKIAAAEEAAEEAAEKAAKEASASVDRSVQELADDMAGPVKTTVSKAGSLDAQMERYNKAAAKRIKSTKVKDVEIGGRDGDIDVRIKGVVGTRIGDSPFIRVTQKNIQQAVDTVPGNKGTATPGLYHEPTGLRLVEGGNVSDHKHLVAMMEDAGIDMVDEKKLTGEQRQKVGKIISAWENDDWSQLPDDIQYSVPERTVPDADFVLDEDTLGHKKMVSRRPAISRTIKAMASENPEFAANPVFNVRGDGKLVYGSYAFSPSAFLPPDAVKKLSEGQTVAVDLEAFNIKPKNTQDALAASFKNAGYKVRKKADSIEVQLGDSKATISRGGEVTGDNTRFVSQVNRVVRSNIAESGGDVDFQHDAFPHPDDLHSTGKHMADGSVNDKASSAYQEAVAIASDVKAVGKKARDKAKEISEIVRTTDPAEIASNALDAVANLWYRLPFGSELTAMFDDTVQGSTAPEGRMIGESVFEAMEESNVQMRRQIKPLIMSLHSTGLFDHSALMRKGMGVRDAAKLINKRNNWMLSYLEETNFGSIPFKDLDVPEGVDIKSVQHTLDTMKEILAKQLKIEQEAGVDISNLTDILIKYFPRIKKKPGKSYRLNPDIGQALSASLENSKQRHLVDIPGGTSVLNEMSIDPNISGLMARNPVIRRKIEQGDLQTLRQYVADTYGDRVSTMYNPKHWGGTAKGEHTYFDKVIKWVAGLDPAYQAEQFPVFGNNIIQDLMERLEHGNRSALQLRGAQQLFGMNAIRAVDGATTQHQIWDMDKALSEINANTDVSYENILGYMDDEIKASAESHVDTYTESLVSRSMFDPESPGKGAEVKRNGTTHTLQQMEDGSFVDRWERTQKMQGNKEEPIYVAGKDNAFVSEDTVRAELSQYGYKDTYTPKEIRKAMREAKEEGHSISFREVPHNKVVAVRLTETRRVAPDQIMDYARELAHSAAVRDFMNNPELGGFGIDKRIGEDLARWMKPFQSPEEVSTFYKGLARITNLMRPALTGPFPSFHFRNFTSGQFTNATYGATDPRYQGPRAVYQPIVDAYQMRSGKPPKGIEKVFDGATPQEAFEKLQSEMFEQNLIGDRIGRASEHLGDDISRTTSQIPGMGSETDPLKALTSLARGDLKGAKSNMSPMPASASMSDLWNPFAAKGGLGYNPGKGVVTEYGEEMFLPYVYGRDVGSFVEDMNRIAPFIAFRRQGYSAKAAADMVKKIQVDYSRLAQWEKKHARAVFPFWTFSSRTLPLTLKEIATNPGGRTATSIKVLSDLQDPDTVAPDYVQETAAIPLGRLSDGSDRYLAGFGLAFEDALNLASGPAKLDAEETLREVASRTTPLVKGPIEWMTQESLFHRAPDGGRDLDDLDPTVGRTLSNLSDWFTGERTKEADPFISRGVEFAVANSPLSRFASTARTMTDTRKWEDPLGLVNLLTGARVTDVSPTARDAILKQRAAHLLKELGAREFKRPYVPDHRLDRMTEEDKVLVGELQELLNTIDQRFRERREAEDAQK